MLVSIWLLWYFSIGDPFRPDFSVYWTAARIAFEAPDRLYDFQFVTSAQSWLANPKLGPRPWVYPPSALPIFMPFTALPFWVAYFVWGAVTSICFWAAARTYVTRWGLILALVSPPVVSALVAGQTSLLTGAGILAGMRLERCRPYLAGIVLGILAAIKPQVLILAPVILWHNKRTLVGFLVGGGLMVAASLPFGIQRWIEWIYSFPKFSQAVEDLGIMARGVTPASAAILLGLDSPFTWIFQIVGSAGGIALAIWAANKDTETRIIGLVCGGLLLTPYAMMHELTPLMPIAAASLLANNPARLLKSLPLIGIGGAFTMPAMAVASFCNGTSSKIERSISSVAN